MFVYILLNIIAVVFAPITVLLLIAVAGLLNPVFVELAMALSSITVVTNANLLRRKKI